MSFNNLGKITEHLYKCSNCRRSMHKKDSLIIMTPKGAQRFCRDCQLTYYMKELEEKNPGIDIKMEVEGWSKNIKDAKDGRR